MLPQRKQESYLAYFYYLSLFADIEDFLAVFEVFPLFFFDRFVAHSWPESRFLFRPKKVFFRPMRLNYWALKPFE